MRNNVDKRKVIASLLFGCVALTLAVVGTGCANSTEADPTPVRTFKITPAAQPRTATAIASPSVVAGSTGSAGGGIDIVGRDTKFDVTELSSAPGAVTIRFDNRDSGIVHNLHVFRGTNAQGESVGQTTFAAGPVKQELQVNLAAGTYFFQCDAHPTTMKGTLTVQ
jgi:plastocyanin